MAQAALSLPAGRRSRLAVALWQSVHGPEDDDEAGVEEGRQATPTPAGASAAAAAGRRRSCSRAGRSPGSVAGVALHESERAFVNAFVEAKRRSRWLSRLAGKGRSAQLDRLNHFRDLDVSLMRRLDGEGDVKRLLRSLGAPDDCLIMSDCSDIDGVMCSLEEALRVAQDCYWGTVILCVPGRLAFFKDEADGGTYLLQNP